MTPIQSKTILTLSTLLLWPAGLRAQSQKPLPHVDLEEPFNRITSPASHKCNSTDWSLLSLSQTKLLLADYDLDQPLAWSCDTVDVSWSRSAHILRLHATLGLDDYREISLLMASPTSRVWLIPIERGMVGYPHTEDNPHNLAAFNDLLGSARLRVSDDQLIELSNLYQFIVGMPVGADSQERKTTFAQAIQVNDTEWSYTHKDQLTDVTHRERFGDSWNSTYMVWQFRYTRTSDSVRLIDVTRQTIAKYTEDN